MADKYMYISTFWIICHVCPPVHYMCLVVYKTCISLQQLFITISIRFHT